MNAHEVPKLQSLAEPYQVPGALPDGISVSVALIANTPTNELKEATRSAVSDHFGAELDSRMDLTDMSQNHYDRMTQVVGDSKRKLLEDARDHAAGLQDYFGMQGSVGFDPTAEGLKILMGADDRVAEYAAEVEGLNEYPAIVDAREELIEAMTERAEAEMALPVLDGPKELGNQVERDLVRLSRRGRLGSTAAGLLLGTGAALGLLASSHDTAPEDNAKIVTALTVSASGIGAIVGTGAGSLMSGRFARRRAQSLVRKAQK
jgi:hypothetical protein